MQQNNFPPGIAILLCGTLLAACTGYSFNINDNTVYTPPTLFTDYQIADQALAQCVEQTISDQRASSAEGLTRLDCSSAGIKSLEGLERFRYLSELNLANNQLRRVDELRRLTRLEVLILRENQLEDASPLLSLLRLSSADLSDNPQLDCTDMRQIAQNFDGTFTLPSQCE